MQNNAISSWKAYFYSPEDLKHEKHGKHIRVTNTETSKDLRYFKTLIESVFSSHIISNPKLVDIKNLRCDTSEGIQLFRKEDIDNLFISQYYKYPSISRLNMEDVHQVGEKISPENVFDEIREQIAGPNGILALVGEVGEGKSTFLSKLALDLKNKKSEQKYYPVIIDLLKYNRLLENEYKTDVPDTFWRILSEHIANCLQEDLDFLVTNTITDQIGKETSSGIEANASLSALIAALKAGYSDRTHKKHTEESRKMIEPYLQIVKAADTLIKKHKIRLVLIFDNLDTYCSEHERFMLFPSSWSKLDNKIRIVRDIFWGVTDRFLNSEMSLIFTARPYVYTHAFQSELQDNRSGRLNSVYSLCEVTPDVPIESRSQMLMDLARKLKTGKEIPPGKERAIAPYINGFISLLEQMSSYEKEPLTKFYHISNQGFRSMVNFFRDLRHDRNLFQRYFTHDILYLYLLSKRSLYSQVPPDEHYPKPISHFPNVFLISCDNYYNNKNSEACQPHRLTYWLKYLILTIVNRKKRVNIKFILNMLSSYDDHAVRLSLGSLSTANETNCLNLEFPPEIVDLEQIEDSTYVNMTERGRSLIENNNCFSFEYMQLYFDDWLLPRPLPQHLASVSPQVTELLEPEINKVYYSYDYLLNANVMEYGTSRKQIINRKARQSLLLLSILKSAEKYETSLYSDSWSNVKKLLGSPNEPLLSDAIYKKLQERIIGEAYGAMGLSEQFKGELNAFRATLDENQPYFDKFFDELRTHT